LAHSQPNKRDREISQEVLTFPNNLILLEQPETGKPRGKTMTGQLVDRIRDQGLIRVKKVAKKIATESPKLADLPEEDLEKLARVVVAEGLKDELRRAADLEKVDYLGEREKFVARSSRTGSQRTKQLYSDALDKLDAWCKKGGISTLELTPALADDWIESLKAEGKAASSIRLMVAAGSSFWTWLERRHTELRNPFRGTRARPLNKPKRKLEIPTEAEIRILENAAEEWLRAAIVLMSQVGLRAGALPSLSVSGDRYTCTTKGKEQRGKMPQEAREAIQKAGLSLRSPFQDKAVHQIEDSFRYLTKKLHGARQIAARYSCHDLRHFFAIEIYGSTHDVYQVEKALGHANVAVTETYLRSLGLET
jgi:site-specific recombinase XerD